MSHPSVRGGTPGWIGQPQELCHLVGLPATVAEEATEPHRRWPLRVPIDFVARMRPGDLNDPLLKQVLPTPQELGSPDGFLTDPLGEAGAACGPGLIRKYQGRALLVTTRQCAVHCRFCFRRHFNDHPLPSRAWESSLALIGADPSLSEVILSGGDPLMLDDAELTTLVESLDGIPHLRRLRIHTRAPIVAPRRVTESLLTCLSRRRLTPIVVVHANHPNEVDRTVVDALGRLIDAGIPILHQAVLLRGVNDRTELLAELFQGLVDRRVIPYYLHQLDRVAGAAHFEVPEAEGLRLLEGLRAVLPGYAVPRYVRERPGRPSKDLLA